MEKTFEVAGTSTLNGVNTYRFANGKVAAREAVLKRNGHTDVALFMLPSPMTKDAATAYMVQQGLVAVMPTGHRKTDNPRKAKVEQAVEAVQHDAHVTTRNEAAAAEAAKKAAFVEKMRLAREAKRAAREAAAAEEVAA